MHTLRISAALLFVLAASILPSMVSAQTGEPTIAQVDRDGLLGPGGSATYFTEITNTTDTPISVSGVQMIDVLDTSEVEPERCPRVWFGDAGYSDRPRGEDEQNPPSPPYPLPGVTLESPVELQPGESFALPGIDLFMIQAAPNACQSRQLTIVYQADWQFQAPVQTYGTVAGSVTDAAGEPLAGTAVSITGTTDEGAITEELTAAADGTYASTNDFHTETELTVSASADGYVGASSSTTVVEGENTVNIALEQAPVPTGSVSGTLTNIENGEPIPNASIELSGVDADGNQISETVYSNASGQFSSTLAFQAGTAVSISISAEGYEPIQVTIESVTDGMNTVTPGIAPIQVDDPTETPTPDPVETETPTPDPDATETPPTETEPPAATPVPSDPGPTAPVESGEPAPTESVVSGLPSTGSGSATHIGLIVSGALATTAMIGIAIRRHDN